MEIKKNINKRAYICKAYAIELDKMTAVNYPGSKIKVSGEFKEIHYSTVEFSEEESINGEPVSQELVFQFFGKSEKFDQSIKTLTDKYNCIKLEYSNGESILVGTPDNPVSFKKIVSDKGNKSSLEVGRLSAEPAKHLI